MIHTFQGKKVRPFFKKLKIMYKNYSFYFIFAK
jgi:hypothetical protein